MDLQESMEISFYRLGENLYVLSPDGTALVKSGRRNYRESTEYTDDKGRKWQFNQETRRWRLHPDSKKQKPASTRKPKAKAEPKPETKAKPETELKPKAKKDPKPKKQGQEASELGKLKSQIAELQKLVAKLEAENKRLQSGANATTSASAPKAKPIESYEDFKSEVMQIYDQLNEDYNLGDLVPIYRIRRILGDRVSRPQFKQWLLDIQKNDIVRLMGAQESNIPQDQMEDSITTMGNFLRYYVRRL